MILALAGQFKQLSHEPEKFRWLNGIRTHDLRDADAVLSFGMKKGGLRFFTLLIQVASSHVALQRKV